MQTPSMRQVSNLIKLSTILTLGIKFLIGKLFFIKYMTEPNSPKLQEKLAPYLSEETEYKAMHQARTSLMNNCFQNF